MKAIDMQCSACNADVDAPCDQTNNKESFIGSFHKSRVLAASKLERDRNTELRIKRGLQ
jgi:hypothetical protein